LRIRVLEHKFGENAKFLETIPIRMIVMALNVEGCNERGKKTDLR
jgi:hypothetical protein